MFSTALCPRCTAIVTVRTEGRSTTYRCAGCGAGPPARPDNVIDLRTRRVRPAPGDRASDGRQAA